MQCMRGFGVDYPQGFRLGRPGSLSASGRRIPSQRPVRGERTVTGAEALPL